MKTEFPRRAIELLSRLGLGFVFVSSGWGKLANLPSVIDYFASLGIPWPSILAPFVAGVEGVGGLFLIAGLLTRTVSGVLGIIMVVALVAAKREEITDWSALLSLSEFLYVLLFLWIASAPEGAWRVDTLLFGKRKNAVVTGEHLGRIKV